MKKYIPVLLFIIILFSKTGTAQLYQQKNSGARIAVVLALGTHFDRIGFCANGYYFDNWFQANTELRAYYNFKNLGPKKKHFEFVAAFGFAIGYGKTDTLKNFFYSSVSNQTKYQNSFAYSYNLYFNKIKTTQQTGIISLQFKGFSFITENDIFARQTLDRFRTGAFLLQYQYMDFQFALNSTLWTGQMGEIVKGDPHFPNGYVDTTGAVYPEFSHGLLSLQVKTNSTYYQYGQLNLGLDAEQVRNVLQNKIVHNVFRSKNSDLPMLDRNKNQYLYKDGQKIKKTKFYLNAFLNPNIFY